MAAGMHMHIGLSELRELTDDPIGLARLKASLGQQPVVSIGLQILPQPAEVAALARHFGEPLPYPTDRMRTAPGFPIIGDFSAAGLPEDGRPRVATLNERLHVDVMDAGLAAYGLLHARSVPEAAVMRFVDMRAVYAGLPASLKATLARCSARHYPRATEQRPKPSGTLLPLVALHPSTRASVLILPNARDSRVEGLPEAEGRALIAELWAAVEDSPHRFQSVLRSNEIWLWDNVATVHDNPAFPRHLDRVVWFLNIPGEGKLAAASSCIQA